MEDGFSWELVTGAAIAAGFGIAAFAVEQWRSTRKRRRQIAIALSYEMMFVAKKLIWANRLIWLVYSGDSFDIAGVRASQISGSRGIIDRLRAIEMSPD